MTPNSDLNNLSDRELLVRLYERVEGLMRTLKAQADELEAVQKLELRNSERISWTIGFLGAAWGAIITLLGIFARAIMTGG